jgi:hypothetical protein
MIKQKPFCMRLSKAGWQNYTQNASMNHNVADQVASVSDTGA